jgi:hypothetical protein
VRDLRAPQPVGQIERTVDSKIRIVETQLRILDGETFEPFLGPIRLSIAVGVP